MKKENVKNLVGVILFYAIIIMGVVALNARVEYLHETNNIVSLEK